jgi:hypothetical protein
VGRRRRHSALTIADFNGDGRPDAAMPSESDETVRIHLNACAR